MITSDGKMNARDRLLICWLLAEEIRDLARTAPMNSMQERGEIVTRAIFIAIAATGRAAMLLEYRQQIEAYLARAIAKAASEQPSPPAQGESP